MKTPKQLTPKSKQKSTPKKSEGRIAKANKKSSPKGPSTPVGGIQRQKTPKSVPQSNGQSPVKKASKTPKAGITKTIQEETPKPSVNDSPKTVSPKQQKTDKVWKMQKRKKPEEDTPTKEEVTSPDTKPKTKRVRSLAKRLQLRQQKKQNNKQLLIKLKSGDPSVLKESAKIEAKLAELKDRKNLSKNAIRTVRRYKRYLNMINSIKAGGKSDSDSNEDAKETKSRKQQPPVKTENVEKMESKCEVFVKNLPFDVEVKEVEEYFGQAGEVVKVTVKRGYAFVQLQDEEMRQKALGLTETVLKGRKITVESTLATNKDGVKKSSKKKKRTGKI